MKILLMMIIMIMFMGGDEDTPEYEELYDDGVDVDAEF